jgi:hypothetical protein
MIVCVPSGSSTSNATGERFPRNASQMRPCLKQVVATPKIGERTHQTEARGRTQQISSSRSGSREDSGTVMMAIVSPSVLNTSAL